MRPSVLFIVVLLASPVAAQQTDSLRLDRLRSLAGVHPDSFEIVLAFGRALARSASAIEAEWRPRRAAEQALERAMRLRPDDPRPFLELGVLRRKQGMRVDALRMLRRAEARAEATDPSLLSLADRAAMHHEMGVIYETAWEDVADMGILPSGFASGSCSALHVPEPMWVSLGGVWGGGRPGTADLRGHLVRLNFVCPEVFDEVMGRWHSIESDGDDEFANLMHHFRRAADLDPGNIDVAVRLLRHLADAGAWSEFMAVAAELARHRPDDARATLFLGLGYRKMGFAAQADSVFDVMLRQADSEQREDLLRPEQLLARQDSVAFSTLPQGVRDELTDVFWRARDPLFLTSENERVLEHLARLAYVEVAFSSPTSGERGRWSERGTTWLRYGPPEAVRAIGVSGGRLEFWDYGPGTPDFVFHRLRTYRGARHHTLSADFARRVRERAPELYGVEGLRFVASVPFQAAAFRGSDGTPVLEVYAAVPGATLAAESDVTIDVGTFVLTGDFWETVGSARGQRANAGTVSAFDAVFTLPSGRYVVSAEAAAGSIAAHRRIRITVPNFDDSLSVSDLLLVERFGVEPGPFDDRAALEPEVSRTLTIPAGAPISLLWEVYGLETDTTGMVRYTVRAEVTDSRHESLFIRLLRGLIGAEPDQTRVAWDAERTPRADGAVVESVTIDLADRGPGLYRAFIQVTDRLSGRTYTVQREFVVKAP